MSIKIARTLSLVGRELGKETINRRTVGRLLSRLTKDELLLVAATQADLAGTELPRTKGALSALLTRSFVAAGRRKAEQAIGTSVSSEKANIDRKTINAMAKEMKPFFAELRRDARFLRDVKPETILTAKVKSRVKKTLHNYHGTFKRQFAELTGEDVSDQQVTSLLNTAMEEGMGRLAYALDRHTSLHKIMEHNLQADGVWQRTGPMLAWQTSGGQELVFNVKQSATDKAAGLGIMIGLFVLELVAMFAALLGVVLPKIPAGLADNVGREMARPRNRRLLRRLMKILSDAGRSMAEKVEAIFKWVQAMFEAGFFGLLFKKLFDGLSGWRIALIIAMMIAQLAAMFVPGVGQALVIKKGATIALGLGTMAGKLWEITDIMEA
ncbi:MAG: hypothetical protein ACE5GK_10960 [Nitrospiria bacterium]